MDILFEQLWNGNLVPCKTCGRGDPELKELAKLIEKNKSILDDVLGEAQKKHLQNYMDCCHEYDYLLTVHAFREGFSLAGKLLIETLR